MALAALMRAEVAKRLAGFTVFTEPQVQYQSFPAILIETPRLNSDESAANYVKQIELVITVMFKAKKEALLEVEKLCDKIQLKLQKPLSSIIYHQWQETTFEQHLEQEQPLVIAKLNYSILIEGN
jgi:hypothetical protein